MTWLTVVLLGQALVPWGEIGDEHDSAEQHATHSAPCPDETPEGDPCSDDCSCLCCPGHARVLPNHPSALVQSFDEEQWLVGGSTRLPPFDVINRVYRPPRAA